MSLKIKMPEFQKFAIRDSCFLSDENLCPVFVPLQGNCAEARVTVLEPKLVGCERAPDWRLRIQNRRFQTAET